MKIKQLQILKSLLEQMPEEANMRFKYAVNKNIQIIEDLLEPIETTEKQAKVVLKDYDAEYEKEKNALIMDLGELRADGGREINSNSPNYKKWIGKHSELLKNLSEKYEAQLKEYEKNMKELEPQYNEDVDFAPYKVSNDFTPVLPRKVLKFLMDCGIITE